MFVHVELSHDFLAMMAEYYSITGDLQFVKKNWDALQGAYRYCQSLLDPKDGLPRIPTGKQGSNEQDPLSDELTLSAGWVAASEAYAELSRRPPDDNRLLEPRPMRASARDEPSRQDTGTSAATSGSAVTHARVRR